MCDKNLDCEMISFQRTPRRCWLKKSARNMPNTRKDNDSNWITYGKLANPSQIYLFSLDNRQNNCEATKVHSNFPIFKKGKKCPTHGNFLNYQ